MYVGLRRINFAFDCSEVEPAIVAHKIGDGFELAFDKGFIVADDGDAESGDDFAAVVVNFGNGYIEPALQSADNAFDNAAFFFQRADTVKVQIGCHHADYHKQSSVVQADAVEDLLLFELQFGGLVLHN
jgi:hypothetical protein